MAYKIKTKELSLKSCAKSHLGYGRNWDSYGGAVYTSHTIVDVVAHKGKWVDYAEMRIIRDGRFFRRRVWPMPSIQFATTLATRFAEDLFPE